MDIGANLTDHMFEGIYHGKAKHPEDLDQVIQRSFDAGVRLIVITVGSVCDLQRARAISETHENIRYTIGEHPTNANQPLAPVYDAFEQCKSSRKLAFIGELGLDYDRLEFAGKEQQIEHFEQQLEYFCSESVLPLFLHCRNAFEDFLTLIANVPNKKVIHSFTGTVDEMQQFIKIGCYIGFNGCSFKEESELENARVCPADKILIESDCPWCDIRRTHAGFAYLKNSVFGQYQTCKCDKFVENCIVKSRNEPMSCLDVCQIIAAIKGINYEELLAQTIRNTMEVLE